MQIKPNLKIGDEVYLKNATTFLDYPEWGKGVIVDIFYDAELRPVYTNKYVKDARPVYKVEMYHNIQQQKDADGNNKHFYSNRRVYLLHEESIYLCSNTELTGYNSYKEIDLYTKLQKDAINILTERIPAALLEWFKNSETVTTSSGYTFTYLRNFLIRGGLSPTSITTPVVYYIHELGIHWKACIFKDYISIGDEKYYPHIIDDIPPFYSKKMYDTIVDTFIMLNISAMIVEVSKEYITYNPDIRQFIIPPIKIPCTWSNKYRKYLVTINTTTFALNFSNTSKVNKKKGVKDISNAAIMLLEYYDAAMQTTNILHTFSLPQRVTIVGNNHFYVRNAATGIQYQVADVINDRLLHNANIYRYNPKPTSKDKVYVGFDNVSYDNGGAYYIMIKTYKEDNNLCVMYKNISTAILYVEQQEDHNHSIYIKRQSKDPILLPVIQTEDISPFGCNAYTVMLADSLTIIDMMEFYILHETLHITQRVERNYISYAVHLSFEYKPEDNTFHFSTDEISFRWSLYTSDVNGESKAPYYIKIEVLFYRGQDSPYINLVNLSISDKYAEVLLDYISKL